MVMIDGVRDYCDAVTAQLVGEWLAWRGEDTAPLFCGIYRGKAINRSLETTKVKLIVKEATAAQELLRAGFEMAAIMRAGEWRSNNVLARYLEYAEHNVWES